VQNIDKQKMPSSLLKATAWHFLTRLYPSIEKELK